MTRRRLLVPLLMGLILLATPASLRANYYVWICYGGQWSTSAITPQSSTAQSYAKQFQAYGYSTYITTGSYPPVSCGTPAQTCFYYAKVSYYGQVGYLGGYTTSSGADTAGRNWVRGVGAGAYYYGWLKSCQ